MHQQYGDDIILKYNGKVYQILEKIKYEQENNCDNTSSNCSTLAGA